MESIRECPDCNSDNISGAISVDRGSYMQRVSCNNCGQVNHVPIGIACVAQR